MQKLAVPFPALSETARSVVIDLLVHGPLSRADLARRAGMSPATLTRVARSLNDVGLITESDTASTQRTGRPAQPMDVNADLAHLVGIKLSATQLNLVTTDMRARILSDRTIPLGRPTQARSPTSSPARSTKRWPPIPAFAPSGSAWPDRCRRGPRWCGYHRSWTGWTCRL